MNKFTEAEEKWAAHIANTAAELAAICVQLYAEPQDRDAATDALLQAVAEKLKGEKE